MKTILAALCAALILPAILLGGEVSKTEEDDLFSDPDTVLDNKKFEKKETDEELHKKRIAVSGLLTSVNNYVVSRPDGGGDEFTPYILGALYLDLRLPAEVKGFGNFEAQYDASMNKAEFFVRELFIDFNIAKAVYFRTGKQIIQWGRCYLWNPTDLVNVEKKPFLTKIGSREGTYGIKMHIPFGTAVNIYGVANTINIKDAADIAGAGKIEFVIGGTEMSFSAWGKRNARPVYGYDFSTRLLQIDIVGEASLSWGSNGRRIRVNNGILTAERIDEKLVPRASIDFGHAFDFNGQPDKIQVNLEFFYNGEGYRENIFSDDYNNYIYDVPVPLEVDGATVYLPGGNKSLYLAGNDLFELNYHSRYYAALFVTVTRFFTSDFTLKMNVIGNLEQQSYIGNLGLSYANINDFKAGIEVYGFFGRKDTEYNFTGNAAMILLTAGIVF